jgi:hypothetical protein
VNLDTPVTRLDDYNVALSCHFDTFLTIMQASAEYREQMSLGLFDLLRVDGLIAVAGEQPTMEIFRRSLPNAAERAELDTIGFNRLAREEAWEPGARHVKRCGRRQLDPTSCVEAPSSSS